MKNYKDIVTFTFTMFFSLLVVAQVKNTMLHPVKLTDQEIEVIVKQIEKLDKDFDSAVNLLWSTGNPHYHSDFKEKTRVHSSLPSLRYAALLLDSQKPENRERAFKVLSTAIALQDKNTESKTCGVWPYHKEEPLSTKKAPADHNWADFCAIPIIGIINNHSKILPENLKKETENALLLASEAIRKRNVQPDYTNISLMGLYVCYMTADMYHNTDLMKYARQSLKAFYDCTLLNKGFIEYNSPPYLKLAVSEVLRLKNHVINKEDHAMLDSIYNVGWDIVAKHYHKPSAQWAGPHGRCYSVLLSPSTYSWLYDASDGIINPRTSEDYSKEEDPVLKHSTPKNLMRYFTKPEYPRMQIDTLIRGGQRIELNPLVSYQESDRGVFITTKEVIGKSYFTNDFVLSTANRSCLWNQRRPLIAYWGTSQKPVSMQIRFLHDMYDYSSANIFCAQDSTNVLGAINFTTNGGDKHVTIDVIKDGTIKASDLRLRFEFGGDIENVNFSATNAKSNTVKGSSGNVNFRVEIPFVKFGNYEGSLITGGDDKNKWIDLVLYSGTEREFNFEKMEEAAIGFLLSLSTDKITHKGSVKITKSGDHFSLSKSSLAVKVLLKPYSERATLILK